MSTNKEGNNEPTETTIEIGNFEDELNKLNVNNTNINKSSNKKNKKIFNNISPMTYNKKLVILIIIIIISFISLLLSIIFLVVPLLNEIKRR